MRYGGKIMTGLGLQLTQGVVKFRSSKEGRREKIKHVAF
jgi:hypothetical protein